MNGAYVLTNKKGEVVRTFRWSGNEMNLVYRLDTRRVELVSTFESLDQEQIPYEILGRTTSTDIKKKPLYITHAGSLRWVDEIKTTAKSVEVKEEEDRYWFFQKWTSAVQVALIALIFLVSFILNKYKNEQPEPQTVRIAIEKIAPAVVQPLTVPEQPRQEVRAQPIKIVQNKTMKATHSPIKTSGTLAVLGSLTKSNRAGGLKVDSLQVSAGPGLGGGRGGSGGMQTSVYSKGLLGAPVGPGAKATGLGGYGTKGRGGGQAGYGQMSLVGSSSAYFEPVGREAVIEGGLTREQIAAVIEKNLGQVRYCYEKGLERAPHASGRISIKFFINASGLVNTASIANSSLQAQEVENCIVSNLKAWKFPEPRGGVTVKVMYPFVLKRVSQG